MLQLLIRSVSSLGTAITAYAFLTAPGQALGVLVRGLIIGLIVLAIGLTLWDIYTYSQKQPRTFTPNSTPIVEYLRSWLNSGGRAAIFTRDLSWVDDAETQKLLEKKAAKGELILFVGRPTPLIQRLRDLGAEVRDYSPTGIDPEARFTIIDYGKVSARITIGVVENKKHVVREYGSADQSVMALARDLVRFARHATHP